MTTFRELRHLIDSNTVEAYTLYGLTKKKPGELTGLNRFWNFSPELKVQGGARSEGFLKAERAYQLVKQGRRIKFSVAATEKSPLYNPVFSIGNWAPAKTTVQLTVNGKALNAGVD